MLKLSDIKGIGPKTEQLLNKISINTVDDLIQKTENEMMKVRNLGKKSLTEVKNKLAELDLGLKEEDV